MGVKLKFNARELEFSIRQIGKESLANGARSLRRVAERTVKLAQEYAPVDDGELTLAIDYDTLIEPDAFGRRQYVVFVNPDIAAGPEGEKVVGDYALLIERGMAPYGSGKYHLGPASEAKDGGRGKVGGRFFERAVQEASARAVEDIAGDIRAHLKRGGKAEARIVNSQNRLKSRADYSDGGDN